MDGDMNKIFFRWTAPDFLDNSAKGHSLYGRYKNRLANCNAKVLGRSSARGPGRFPIPPDEQNHQFENHLQTTPTKGFRHEAPGATSQLVQVTYSLLVFGHHRPEISTLPDRAIIALSAISMLWTDSVCLYVSLLYVKTSRHPAHSDFRHSGCMELSIPAKRRLHREFFLLSDAAMRCQRTTEHFSR
ncbi:hypothetical protein BV25DRAFT_306617 [Artomyces pyxidatus]|uniref:Uncharacterized protein n=1 Tax=Artomyces pyxidatus TaxID=48021 RepID=A0ACB8T7R3_9AGAM|nr:hypothetical protein BV25DRAFT_306617 [Artomyces pyxidatus]